MDYSEFEGKVIKYTMLGNREFDGLIVGCDYDIGITIVNAKDKKQYLYCLLGPSSYPELYETDRDYSWYNEVFESGISMLKEGFLDLRIIHEIDKKYNESCVGVAGPDSCAFNK